MPARRGLDVRVQLTRTGRHVSSYTMPILPDAMPIMGEHNRRNNRQDPGEIGCNVI